MKCGKSEDHIELVEGAFRIYSNFSSPTSHFQFKSVLGSPFIPLSQFPLPFETRHAQLRALLSVAVTRLLNSYYSILLAELRSDRH